jgi:hypothetical protein
MTRNVLRSGRNRIWSIIHNQWLWNVDEGPEFADKEPKIGVLSAGRFKLFAKTAAALEGISTDYGSTGS